MSDIHPGWSVHADCWTAAYPDFDFDNLSLDIQEIVTAAYWLGAAEAVSALVCAEPGEVVDQIEEGVGGGRTRH